MNVFKKLYLGEPMKKKIITITIVASSLFLLSACSHHHGRNCGGMYHNSLDTNTVSFERG